MSAVPAQIPAVPVIPSEGEYEALTRAFWDTKEPGSEVSVTVRRGGKVVRYVLIEPDGRSVSLAEPDAVVGAEL